MLSSWVGRWVRLFDVVSEAQGHYLLGKVVREEEGKGEDAWCDVWLGWGNVLRKKKDLEPASETWRGR